MCICSTAAMALTMMPNHGNRVVKGSPTKQTVPIALSSRPASHVAALARSHAMRIPRHPVSGSRTEGMRRANEERDTHQDQRHCKCQIGPRAKALTSSTRAASVDAGRTKPSGRNAPPVVTLHFVLGNIGPLLSFRPINRPLRAYILWRRQGHGSCNLFNVQLLKGIRQV